MERARLVCFDLDGTLVRGTTVSQYLADAFDHSSLVTLLEERYASQEITNAEVARQQGHRLSGRTLNEVVEALVGIPRITGIGATLARLQSARVETLLCTVTWRFAAQASQAWYGFAAVCGTEMAVDTAGRLTGAVTRHFDKYDKRAFVEDYCAANATSLADCVAVGDSSSDVPLFEVVGLSIALNATRDARAVATVSLDTDRLTDILPFIPGLDGAGS